MLQQVIDNADHKMVVSYIPNCWASLRRWQHAQQTNRSLVTDDEFAQVDGALMNLKRQLRNLESQLILRPGSYKDSKAADRAALQQEYENIETTRMRLGKLRDARISEADVYGLFAGLPELIENGLPRWNAHPENKTQEQLAMAPVQAEDNERAIAAITGAHIVGAPYHLDIDSVV